jgi:hypothetical protein
MGSSPGALRRAFHGAQSSDIIPSAAPPVMSALFRERRLESEQDEQIEDSRLTSSRIHHTFPLYSSN